MDGGGHYDKEQTDLDAREDAKEFSGERAFFANKPVPGEQDRQDESRNRDKLAKAAAGIFRQLKIGRILHKLHSAKQIRHLNDHKAQEKQVHKTQNDADFDRAER